MSSEPAPAPELLIVGTLHTLDPQRPRAEAALIRDGVYACVGARAECQAKASGSVRVLELGQGSAVPGLVDAHGHVLGYGRSLLEVSCGGAKSQEECAARVSERVRSTPQGGWTRSRRSLRIIRWRSAAWMATRCG
jgi:hypothetical protein